MKKIVLAIDSFKGCLSSKEIEQCIAEEIHRILPSCQTVCIPIADGGEGMLDTLIEATQGTFVSTQAHDPLMRIRPARYGILGDQRTAIIEMAEINGLTTLSPIERNPMKTSTYGTGELIKDALEKGFRRFIIGIGGSATNDAGMGMIQALGAHLYDKQGNELGQGGKIMEQIAHIDLNHLHPALKEATFIVACDVQNPFCGPQGAAYVFARQKGASEEQIRQLDEGMRHLALLIERDFSYDAVDFDRKITNADWIITGEGKADRQTAEGKVPAGVLKRAKKANIPVMLISGKVEDKACLKQMGFARIVQISPDTLPLEEAMRPEVTRENIRRAIGRELIVNNE